MRRRGLARYRPRHRRLFGLLHTRSRLAGLARRRGLARHRPRHRRLFGLLHTRSRIAALRHRRALARCRRRSRRDTAVRHRGRYCRADRLGRLAQLLRKLLTRITGRVGKLLSRLSGFRSKVARVHGGVAGSPMLGHVRAGPGGAWLHGRVGRPPPTAVDG